MMVLMLVFDISDNGTCLSLTSLMMVLMLVFDTTHDCSNALSLTSLTMVLACV